MQPSCWCKFVNNGTMQEMEEAVNIHDSSRWNRTIIWLFGSQLNVCAKDASLIRALCPQGAWSGPWVSTEVLAAAIGILVYYFAFSAKSTIQAWIETTQHTITV